MIDRDGTARVIACLRGRLAGAGLSRARRGHRSRTCAVRRSGIAAERLEPRWPMAADVLITELVASNDQGLEDEDGDDSDWLELYNQGDQRADLSGWFLTDDPRKLQKWQFPPTSLEPQQYLVVFASGKDRRQPDEILHTNFRLSADGEYVALVRPDGTTVAQDFDPVPPLATDLAFGMTQAVTLHSAVPEGADVRLQVPSVENGGSAYDLAWASAEFDDAAWQLGSGGVGYELQAGFEPWIGTDVAAEMLNRNASVLLRIPFLIDRARSVFSLTLRMRYDDGYVAYLNGIEVARRNAPEQLSWDATATASHVDRDAVLQAEVAISDFLHALRDGTNVLAIHGLNSSIDSNDFLISPELVIGLPGQLATVSGRYLELPTPGGPNGEISYGDFIRPSTASAARGVYDQPFDLVVESPSLGATMVYTTDGSLPSLENGRQAAAPHAQAAPRLSLRIERTTTLRVRVFHADALPSPIETWTYVLPADVMQQDSAATLAAGFPASWRRVEPDYGLDADIIGLNDLFGGVYRDQFVASLKSIPSVSLVMNVDDLFGEEGIYTNPSASGLDWERPTSVEFISADGSINQQVNAGIRIAGGASREHANTKKKSFRLLFRSEYGAAKLRFPLFGPDAADRFDTIVLRNNYNDGWQWRDAEQRAQYARDEWARRTQLAMGRPAAHGTYMHLYINGIYWGLYNLAERPDASFAASYLGGDKDEWDALNTGTAVNGSADIWRQVNQQAADVRSPDAATAGAAYQRLLGNRPDGSDDPQLETLVDVDNLIDYMILNFYAGNTDWPGRNWYVARRRGPESAGFQFFAWDSEWIFDLKSSVTIDRTSVDDGVANLYGLLRDHPDFRRRFAERAGLMFSPGGALYVNPEHPLPDAAHLEWNVPAARYREITDSIELPLVAESARWGDQHIQPSYTVAHWRAERDQLLKDYFSQRSAVVLEQLRRAGLLSATASPGDFNADGQVDIRDVDLLSAAVLANDNRFDLTGDRNTDQADWFHFVTTLLNTTFGDANLDRRFGTQDLIAVFQAGEYEDRIARNSTWSDGDWNADGEFGTADLVLAFQYGDYSAAAQWKPLTG